MISLNIPVIKTTLPNHESRKKEILEYISKSCTESYNDESHDAVIFCDYNRSVDSSRSYLKSLLPDLGDVLLKEGEFFFYKELKIHNIWFQQYYENDIHDWHIHSEAQYTGVYYVQINELSPQTQFCDPISKEVFEIGVKEGDVIFFPSFVIHRSPKITDNLILKKTIVSFNFSFLDIEL